MEEVKQIKKVKMFKFKENDYNNMEIIWLNNDPSIPISMPYWAAKTSPMMLELYRLPKNKCAIGIKMTRILIFTLLKVCEN